MRVKAGPGVMEPDGDTTHGQMDNLIMEEVTNSTCSFRSIHCMYVFPQLQGNQHHLAFNFQSSPGGWNDENQSAEKGFICKYAGTIIQ